METHELLIVLRACQELGQKGNKEMMEEAERILRKRGAPEELITGQGKSASAGLAAAM
jgi:hypothetical protein